MSGKEMQSILEISPIDKAKGMILGEHRGRAVCMPEDTRLNRHIAVFGASGTMKSRAVIRNALFQSINFAWRRRRGQAEEGPLSLCRQTGFCSEYRRGPHRRNRS